MFRILLLLTLTLPSYAITCSNLVIDEVTDRTITAHWEADEYTYYVRARYGPSVVTTNTQGLGGPGSLPVPPTEPVRQQITGLSPSTSYAIAFSSSADGVTYCSELTDTQVTTAAASSTPVAPTDWDTNTVKTPGGTTINVNAWVDLDAALQTATHTAGTAAGDIVALAPGLNCLLSTSAPDGVWHFNSDGRVGGWINTWSASGDTLTHVAHGLVNGDIVYLGTKFNYSTAPAPLAFGHAYYVVNKTNDTIQLSLTNGGAVVTLTSTGLDFLVGKGQPCLAEVLVTTQGASTLYPPEGVRTNDSNYSLATLTNDSTTALRAFDLSYGAASCVRFANIRFVSDNGASVTNPDPGYTGYFMYTWSQGSNHDVIFDRIVTKGANDAPSRMQGAFVINGTRMAVVNSYAKDISYWVPYTDCSVNSSATVSTITGPCKAYRGNAGAACAITTTTATITGGTTTGNSYWYIQPTDCAIKFLSDPSLTVTCSNCAQVTSAAPSNYPNSASKFTQIPIAAMTLAGGNFTGTTSANASGCCFGQQFNGNEASAAFVVWDKGPGPTKIENNTCLNCMGIPIYATGDTYDSGGNGNAPATPLLDQPSNVIIRKNRIEVEDAYISSTSTFNQKGVWGGRNVIEFKWAVKALISGNKIINLPRTNITNSTAIVLTPLSSTNSAYTTATTVQDVEISYNTLTNVAQALSITTRYSAPLWGGFPTRRIWFHNNIITVDGTYRWTPVSEGTGQFVSLFGVYDFRASHNTIATVKGSSGLLTNLATYRFGNFKWENNLQFINDTTSWRGLIYSDPIPANPTNSGLKAKAALDAVATPSYSYAGNAFICGYLDSSTLTQLNQTQCDTIRTAYSTLTSASYWPSGADLATRLAVVKFLNYSSGDYRLKYDSPFISGAALATDGLSQGADIDALQAAQGDVSNLRILALATTSVTIAFLAPDTTGCTVDRSSDSFATWTRVSNAGGSRAQTVNLTSLTTATNYQARVNCQSQQPVIGFRTK